MLEPTTGCGLLLLVEASAVAFVSILPFILSGRLFGHPASVGLGWVLPGEIRKKNRGNYEAYGTFPLHMSVCLIISYHSSGSG